MSLVNNELTSPSLLLVPIPPPPLSSVSFLLSCSVISSVYLWSHISKSIAYFNLLKRTKKLFFQPANHDSFIRTTWLIGKDSDVGRDWGQEEKGTTEDEMAGWHHWLDRRKFEWTPGVGDGQGGLVCCTSWGRKESDTTEWLNWLIGIYDLKTDNKFQSAAFWRISFLNIK